MILVADQNRTTADLLVRRLQTDGFAAQAVCSATVAERVIEAAVAQGILEAVVLDPALPGGGLELLARLRALPRTSRVPVVVFGTSDRKEDESAAKSAGANAWLVKGRITPSTLVARVRDVMGPVAKPVHDPSNPAEYFLWVQPGSDAARLSTDIGASAGFKCRSCGGSLSLYLRRDPERMGEWLLAKIGCLVCARRRAPPMQVMNEPQAAAGGAR
jgi:CheY-like chemotaxis protein